MHPHLRVDSGSGHHIFEPMIVCINSIEESSLVPARDHEVEVMFLSLEILEANASGPATPSRADHCCLQHW